MLNKKVSIALYQAGIIFFVVLILISHPTTSHAEPIEFTFGGTFYWVEGIYDSMLYQWDSVEVGDPWTITFTFESETPPTPRSDDEGVYQSAISYILSFGASNVLSGIDDSGYIRVLNRGTDQVEYYIDMGEGETRSRFGMILHDPSGNALESNALPLSNDIENLMGIDGAYGYLRFDNDMQPFELESWFMDGDVDYFGNPVPEPTTMLLFATGLIGLAGLTRKKLRI